MNEIIRKRRKLCLEIADEIGTYFQLNKTEYDVDVAARLVDIHLPLSIEEASAEYEEHSPTVSVPTKPSIIDQLREALGYDKSISLAGVIRGAIERINKYKD